uniref:Uncharacterized protein n=1 Tax=Anopheles atroparvus TaxID=41427 RepID=A0A182JEJ7_ANOAO
MTINRIAPLRYCLFDACESVAAYQHAVQLGMAMCKPNVIVLQAPLGSCCVALSWGSAGANTSTPVSPTGWGAPPWLPPIASGGNLPARSPLSPSSSGEPASSGSALISGASSSASSPSSSSAAANLATAADGTAVSGASSARCRRCGCNNDMPLISISFVAGGILRLPPSSLAPATTLPSAVVLSIRRSLPEDAFFFFSCCRCCCWRSMSWRLAPTPPKAVTSDGPSFWMDFSARLALLPRFRRASFAGSFACFEL